MNRPSHRQEEDVTLMPLQISRKNGVTRHGNGNRPRKRRRMVTTGAAILAVAAIAIGIFVFNESSERTGPLPVHLPPASASYLGLYARGVPASYAPVTEFTNATGSRPDLVMYYSGWYVPFPTDFATMTANHGAVPLVQMDPDNIKVAQIASGRYDGYLSAYAEAVRSYRHPVILSFGHEMNGNWSDWGYQHTSPAAFVAAWRHIVKLFRALDAKNVTWLWTVNIINDSRSGKVDGVTPWWPGNAYVTWVGIDGYYLKPNWQFAPLFGPTISAVRALTSAPILIAETGAVQTAGQPAKINDLFAGVRSYGLLGFVWFNSSNSINQHFAIDSPAAIEAFRKGASTYHRPDS
jgi:mannan endo-1,4-beta-mannosidase